jgi:hypothetical protein
MHDHMTVPISEESRPKFEDINLVTKTISALFMRRQRANGYSFLKPLYIMSGGGRTVDDDISEFGVASVGSIDLKLVAKLKEQLASPDVKQRHHRQTELRWSSDCDTVVNDFETVGGYGPEMYTVLTELIETQAENCYLAYENVPEPPTYLFPRISDSLWHL